MHLILVSDILPSQGIFPVDRKSQVYEHYVIDLLKTQLDTLTPDETGKDVIYCKTALKCLRVSCKSRLCSDEPFTFFWLVFIFRGTPGIKSVEIYPLSVDNCP